MRRTMIAFAILGIILLLCICERKYVNDICVGVEKEINDIYAAMETENFFKVRRCVANIETMWQEGKDKIYVFINHSEGQEIIDEISRLDVFANKEDEEGVFLSIKELKDVINEFEDRIVINWANIL